MVLPDCRHGLVHNVTLGISDLSIMFGPFLPVDGLQSMWSCWFYNVLLLGEDDGHLVTFTQCANDGISEMRVYNAKTMDNQPVARVQLPVRCPAGFHCFHMNENEFQAQASSL